MFDWNVALTAAGFDPAHLQPGKSVWTAPTDTDYKQAWEGVYADQPDVTFHIEAAAYRGKPVWFAALGPWYRPREPDNPLPNGLSWLVWITLVIGATSMIVLVAMARRNLRLGRGDRKGAIRLAIVTYVSLVLALVLRADHATSIVEEIALLMNINVQSAFFGFDIWLVYIAFEPYARRRWPQLMISWSRLLAGRLRDPMVGRDLLLGMLGGVAMILLIHLCIVLPSGLGHTQGQLFAGTITTLTANRHVFFFFLIPSYESIAFGVGALAFMFLFLRVLRIPLLMHLAAFAFLGLILTGLNLPVLSPEDVLFAAIWYLLLIRVGVLAASTSIYVMQVLIVMPLTLDLHAWYAERTLITYGLLTALLIYAFYASLGGKSAFGKAFTESDDG
jgi:hypothetical protein